MTGVARAAVLVGPRSLVIRELPLPPIHDDDALLRVEACGLCGTDHEQFTGVLRSDGPFVPGHESVGVIERIGRSAARRWGVAEGDRVVVEVFLRCGSCSGCTSGGPRRCEVHGTADMYGFVPVDRPPGLWGGYATHQYLAPDSVVLRVPEALDSILATMFNPLGAGIRWAVDLPALQSGETVVILGPGVRGLAACAAAKDAGAGFVMVTGLGERDADRLAIAERFGADLAVDSSSQDPRALLRDAIGTLADVCLDVTANAPQAFGQAVGMVGHGGRVVVAGTRGPVEAPGFLPDRVVSRELTILGALGVDSGSYRAALDTLATGRWPFDELPRRVVGLEGLARLLADMAGEGGTPPVHGVVAP